MAKAEVKLGEGGQEQKGGQLARREDSPLVQGDDIESGNPKALLEAELRGEELIPIEGTDFAFRKTKIRFRNITPGVKKDQSSESSEPPASK